MKSLSTSLGILFGFAIFVNVVATPGPTGSTSEDEREHHQGCGVLFNYVALADNTLQSSQCAIAPRIRQVLECHAVNHVIDFIVMFAFNWLGFCYWWRPGPRPTSSFRSATSARGKARDNYDAGREVSMSSYEASVSRRWKVPRHLWFEARCSEASAK
jgi:hypothetical protein